jgi:hypothetical protein
MVGVLVLLGWLVAVTDGVSVSVMMMMLGVGVICAATPVGKPDVARSVACCSAATAVPRPSLTGPNRTRPHGL